MQTTGKYEFSDSKQKFALKIENQTNGNLNKIRF